MLSNAMLRKIRRIEIRTKKLVNESFAGAYQAVFKGRGVVFDSVRAYEPGDNVRDIDWNVTARAGQPFVKRYVEERELTVMLILDTSASVLFGTGQQSKRDLAAEISATLAFSAISNNDRVGLLAFSEGIEMFMPPRKGRNHALRLIRNLLAAQATQQGTNLGLALQTVNKLLKQRAIVFVISDFLTLEENYIHQLMLASKKHDVIAVVLSDPIEQQWSDVGIVGLRDAETGRITWIDTTFARWRKGFEHRVKHLKDLRDGTLLRAGVDRIDVGTEGDYVQGLRSFFQNRVKRLRV
jgi:uncharacterized protein (DUF58 family)